MFIGRTDAEAETPILWPPHVKSWLIGKDSDTGRHWGQEEKGTTEDEMAGWHHWLDGRESEWTPGVGDGQRGLACWDSWGRKESDRTERLNWTELNPYTLLSKIAERENIFQSLIWMILSRDNPILSHPLPMTLRQERIFRYQATAPFGFWVIQNLTGLYINL